MTLSKRCALLGCFCGPVAASDLSYEHYVDSDRPLKCFYGCAAVIAVSEDCMELWNSVYAMIRLAQIDDTGVAVEQDLEYDTTSYDTRRRERR